MALGLRKQRCSDLVHDLSLPLHRLHTRSECPRGVRETDGAEFPRAVVSQQSLDATLLDTNTHVCVPTDVHLWVWVCVGSSVHADMWACVRVDTYAYA